MRRFRMSFKKVNSSGDITNKNVYSTSADSTLNGTFVRQSDDYNNYPCYKLNDWYLAANESGMYFITTSLIGAPKYQAPTSNAAGDPTGTYTLFPSGSDSNAPTISLTPNEGTGGDTDLTGTIKLTVSGIDQGGYPNNVWGSWMNGNYYLVNPAATVKDRVWQHENPDYTSQIKYYDGMWVLTNNSTSTGYSIYCSEGGPSVNPYKSDYSSYSWSREGNLAPNISVIASVVSSGESGGDTTDPVTINVTTPTITGMYIGDYLGGGPAGIDLRPYVTVSDGSTPTFTLISSTDSGIMVISNSYLSGLCSGSGAKTIKIQVSSATYTGNPVYMTITYVVLPMTINTTDGIKSFTISGAAGTTVSQPFNIALYRGGVVANIAPVYTYTLMSGSLPSGVTLDTTNNHLTGTLNAAAGSSGIVRYYVSHAYTAGGYVELTINWSVAANDSTGDKINSYVVSGAGSPEYDGTYTYLDEYNGYPRYSCLGGDGSTMMYIGYNTSLSAYTISDSMGNTMAYVCAGTGQDIGGKWGIGTASDPAPTVTKGGTDNGSGSGDSYDVSNCGTVVARGTYVYAGEHNNKPYYTYTNTSNSVTYYLSYRSDTSGWGITVALTGAVTPLYCQSTISETPDGGTYIVVNGISPVPTIVKNSGNSDNPDITDLYVTFTTAGSPYEGVFKHQGTYNNYDYWKHESAECYILCGHVDTLSQVPYWHISQTLSTSDEPLYAGYGDTPINTNWYSVKGTAYGLPTVTKEGNAGGDEGGDTVLTPYYTVSGSSNTQVNGDYYLTDKTGVSSTPVYENENGYAIRKQGVGWGIYNFNASSVVHLFSGTMSMTDVPTGTFNGITVTKVENSGGGSGNDDDYQTENARNFTITISGSPTVDVSGTYFEQNPGTNVYKHESKEYYVYKCSADGTYVVSDNLNCGVMVLGIWYTNELVENPWDANIWVGEVGCSINITYNSTSYNL